MKTHCYFDFLNTGVNMQHRIITWADDRFVLYDHYLSNKKIHIFIPGVKKKSTECSPAPHSTAIGNSPSHNIFELEVLGQVAWSKLELWYPRPSALLGQTQTLKQSRWTTFLRSLPSTRPQGFTVITTTTAALGLFCSRCQLLLILPNSQYLRPSKRKQPYIQHQNLIYHHSL